MLRKGLQRVYKLIVLCFTCFAGYCLHSYVPKAFLLPFFSSENYPSYNMYGSGMRACVVLVCLTGPFVRSQKAARYKGEMLHLD